MTDPTTPSRVPPTTRSRVVRRLAGIASVVTALGVLAAPAIVPSSSTAASLTFPYVNTFSSADGGALHGNAVVADGRLRLTEDQPRQAGAWSTNDTFPSDLGLEIEFEYSMHSDDATAGADGLLLYLADGAAPQGVGSFGAGLGYACRLESSQGGGAQCDLPGVPGGFAAVAIDRYGNFSTTINDSGPGRSPDSVVVRGSGDGVTGYRYVAGAPAPGGTATDGPKTRRVQITLLPGGSGELSMTVRLRDGDTMRTVLDTVPLQGFGQAPLPSTLRLGFAGATGSFVDVHEIDALRVWQPADLAVEHELPPTVTAGGRVEYAVTARNVGPNASEPSALTVDVPDALHDVTWSCAAPSGSDCGTDSGSGDVSTDLALPRDGTATVSVTGRVDDGATGELESIATITPAPPLRDVDADDNVSRAIATVADAAHVETEKSVEPSTGVAPGDEVEYLVTARNSGPGVAQDVGAVDELPAPMRFVSSPDGCVAEGQRVTCGSGAPLATGESVSFRIRAALDPEYQGDGSDVVNVATATSPTDPDGGDESPGVSIGVVHPGGPDGPDPTPTPAPTVGPGDGGDGGPGDGGAGTPRGAGKGDGASGDPGGSGRVAGRGALAYTGADGLGVLGVIAGGLVLGGGICWSAARRRVRRGDPLA